MPEEMGQLFVEIDGEWDSREFAGFFQAISMLFDIEALVIAIRKYPELHYPYSLERRLRSVPPFLYDELPRRAWSAGLGAYLTAQESYNPLGHRLDVLNVKYGSHGGILLGGLGEAIKESRETILLVMDSDHRKRMNRAAERKAAADAEAAELDVELKRLELWRTKAEIMRAAGMSEQQVAEILAAGIKSVDFISNLNQQGKIMQISDGRA